MEDLRSVLKLDEHPKGGAVDLSGELVDRIDAAVEAALAEEGGADRLLSLLNPLVQGRDVGVSVLYATAFTQARSGETELAQQIFSILCEQLEQKAKWEPLGAVMERVLAHAGSPEFARVAARLWRKGGGRHAKVDLLRRAYGLDPENHLILWALGASLMEGGDAEGSFLLAKSLPGFAAKKDVERVEEGVLAILERPERRHLVLVTEALDRLIREGEGETAVTLLELAQDALIGQGLAGDVWTILRRALEKSTEKEAFRGVARTMGIAAHGAIRKPERLFDRAGIAEKSVPVEDALVALDRLLELPPGRHVLHGSWGVGEIIDNDGERLQIRFEKEGERSMSVSLAKTALYLLNPQDLRAKVYVDRPGMLSALRGDQAEFLFHVMQHLGGEAGVDDVRKLLVRLELLEPTGWSEWWKQARRGAEKDERFDLSQLFRKVIRLHKEGERTSPLPEVDLKSKLRRGIDLLVKFLEQHPEDAGEVVRRYGEELRVRSAEKDRPPTERVQALLLLRRAGDTGENGFQEAILEFAKAPDLTRFGTEQQKDLLEMAPPEVRETAAFILLDSRVQSIRREAWRILSEGEGSGREKNIWAVIGGSPQRGYAVFHIVRELTGEPTVSQWALMDALVHLIENPEKDVLRRNALDFLETEKFRAALAAAPATDEEASSLRNQLLHWRHSERFLFPIVEALKGTPLGGVAEEVEAQRQSMHATREDGIYDRFGGRVLMTRATLIRLRKEVEELDWDLKTTIPQEIRKARELGDLRENAEYDAAKKKQADATQRLEELYHRVRLAQPIEEIEILEDQIGPGTEVDLRGSGGDLRTYWVLGEGDRTFGDNVISYRAPLGEKLLGKRVGEDVELIDEERFRVDAIRVRLPEAGEGD
ncbi:MAG: GreA/GreB family elongation factor [Candidatus Eisenbacteria bacterium]|nr:GreA/GreB family elongation factor [Candidatus Eisenbacteria bacterium]